MKATAQITSMQNPQVKHFARLRANAPERKREGLMVVEGRDEISLALTVGRRPHILLLAPDVSAHSLEGLDYDILRVSPGIIRKLSYREHPDGWLAVFPTPRITLEDIRLSSTPLLIVLEALEKPGNLGAILRTADAAGVDAVIVCDARTDLYGPNVVRASRGTLFTVPTPTATSRAAIAFLRDRGIRIVAGAPRSRTLFTRQDLTGSIAVVMGTEDRGLTDIWLREADAKVRIPMNGRINSLNVSTATALIVYEALRQRGT